MPAPFNFKIPTPSGPQVFELKGGTSLLFVGANGCGKTRLAVHIESSLGIKAHRISAHRALNLNPSVPKINEKDALMGLRTGHASRLSSIDSRTGNRWGNKSSVYLLNDYDRLIQVLFSEQSNKALETHKKVRSGDASPVEPTKFERLKEVWERLLPHRKLEITGDDIKVTAAGSRTSYEAEEMSDGERAIFYLIG
jgi:energy-coupling factor transporter ATP-binding protein EcfA2